LDYLRQLLISETAQGRLDLAALDVARIQFPDLDHEPILREINEIAANLGDRLRNFNDGRDFVEKAQSYLFGELGFHANETDFFDPQNSCLNQVLACRTGIPITLSLVYMEVARRLQMPVYGISLPNRFLVQFDDGNYATYIDPFGGGQIVTIRQCFAFAGATTPDPSLLARATNKQILMRMLQNLQRAYIQSKDYNRAILTLNFLLDGAPDTSQWYRIRGALMGERGRFGPAVADLERYLQMQPQADDTDIIKRQIQVLRHKAAQRN
jgi:regulator of sirC expression with transglutaminase-like and TPR domain